MKSKFFAGALAVAVLTALAIGQAPGGQAFSGGSRGAEPHAGAGAGPEKNKKSAGSVVQKNQHHRIKESATQQAKRTGKRVELPDAGTATTRVFADPDGTTSAEIHLTPIRTRTKSGWAPITPRASSTAASTTAAAALPPPSRPAPVQHWVMVGEADPAKSWIDLAIPARSGASRTEVRNGVTSPYYRSYFLLMIGWLQGKSIKQVEFRAKQTHSDDCTPQEWQLWETGTISISTTWSTRPAEIKKLGGKTDAYGATGCDPRDVELDITEFIRGKVTGGAETVTIGLRGAETSRVGLKEFQYDSLSFDVKYNTPPEVPVPVTPNDDDTKCAVDWDYYIPTTTPFLNVQVTDSDPGQQNVQATFEWATETGIPLGSFDTGYKLPGTHRMQVPEDRLANTGRYKWRARADDEHDTSAWSPWCHFIIDTSPPNTEPTVTSSDFEENTTAGDLYQTGRFTFSAAGARDVVAFRWGFGDPTYTVPADSPGGSTTVDITPTTQNVQVAVQGVDRAGNAGPIRYYSFDLRPLGEPLAYWPLDDGAGDIAQDYSYRHDNPEDRYPINLSGTEWTEGSQSGALHFDGNAFGSASRAVIDPAKSFSVMAWVKLKDRESDWPILGQDGADGSGLALGYNWWHNRWVLQGRVDDGPKVLSNTQAQVGVWTHVAGVYDAAAAELRIFVNGRLAGSTQVDAPLAANGLFRLGQMTRKGDHHIWRLPGELDEVRVYDRATSETEIQQLMAGQSLLPSGSWKIDEEPGSRVLADETGNGNTMALNRTGASVVSGGKQGNALRLDGADGYAFTAGPALRTDRSFSVAAWVRLSDLSTWRAALSQDANLDSGFYLGYSSYPAGWSFGVKRSDGAAGGEADTAYARPLPVADSWTHLAGVYDSVSRQLRLYVNGELAGTTTRTTSWNSNGSFVVGRALFGGYHGDLWKGDIDEVHAADRTWTQGDVQFLMGSPPGGPGATWTLDEGSGSHAADSTGNQHLLGVSEKATWVTGKLGTGLHFDGDLSNAWSGGPVIRTDRDYTVAAWVKLDAGKDNVRRIALSQEGDRVSGFVLELRPPKPGATPAVPAKWAITAPRVDEDLSGDDSRSSFVASRNPAVAGKWTHLAATFAADTGVLKLYVDGVLDGSTTHLPKWNSTGSFVIGRGRWNAWSTDPWWGTIDEVRVIQHNASATQIKEIMGPAAVAAGPIKMRSVNSGLCVTEQSGDSGFLYQGSCSSVTPPQTLETYGSGTFRVTTNHPVHGAGCMGTDADWSTTRPADNFCVETLNMTLELIPVRTPLQGYRIRFVDNNKCMAVAGDSKIGGADIVYATCDPASVGQVFAFDTR